MDINYLASWCFFSLSKITDQNKIMNKFVEDDPMINIPTAFGTNWTSGFPKED